MQKIQVYDSIIIGGGIAGLSASIYGARFNRKVIVISQMPGGTISTTHIVENYPPIKSISGLELANKFLEHAKEYGVEVVMETVSSIVKKDDGLFEVKAGSDLYVGKTIIYGAGTQWRKLAVAGEKEFANKGVHYCALCDGAFYKNKIIAVVGGGDSALKESLLLAQYASHVYILARKDKVRAEPINLQRVLSNSKIEILTNVEVREFLGNQKLEKLKLSRAVKTKNSDISSDILEVNGAFVLIGHISNTQLAKDLGVILDSHSSIMVDKLGRTNIEGFFACGDCTDSEVKQAIISASGGVSCAYAMDQYLKKSST